MKQRHNRINPIDDTINAMGSDPVGMIVGTKDYKASPEMEKFIKGLGPGQFVNRAEVAELVKLEPEAVLGIGFTNGVRILISCKDFITMLNMGDGEGHKIDSVRLLVGSKPISKMGE